MTQAKDTKPAIAFVVAHPDDVANAMGGTALLLKDAYRLHIVCATRGQRGYAGAAQHGPSAELAATREAEERAAAAYIDAEVTFLEMMDGEIFADRAACEEVAGILGRLKPRALFTLDPYDKPDHAAAAQIAVHALELAGRFWETEIYGTVWPGGGVRRPDLIDVFVNISAVIAEKRAMVACHRTQLPGGTDVESVIRRNVLLGRLAWCEYAEAYRAWLPLMGRRWNRKAGSVLMELTQA